jgi:hypothetical protein
MNEEVLVDYRQEEISENKSIDQFLSMTDDEVQQEVNRLEKYIYGGGKG